MITVAPGDPPSTQIDIAIVWGAERPELLITETFAHHERRTEDLADDNGGESNSVGRGRH